MCNFIASSVDSVVGTSHPIINSIAANAACLWCVIPTVRAVSSIIVSVCASRVVGDLFSPLRLNLRLCETALRIVCLSTVLVLPVALTAHVGFAAAVSAISLLHFFALLYFAFVLRSGGASLWLCCSLSLSSFVSTFTDVPSCKELFILCRSSRGVDCFAGSSEPDCVSPSVVPGELARTVSGDSCFGGGRFTFLVNSAHSSSTPVFDSSSVLMVSRGLLRFLELLLCVGVCVVCAFRCSSAILVCWLFVLGSGELTLVWAFVLSSWEVGVFSFLSCSSTSCLNSKGSFENHCSCISPLDCHSGGSVTVLQGSGSTRVPHFSSSFSA